MVAPAAAAGYAGHRLDRASDHPVANTWTQVECLHSTSWLPRSIQVIWWWNNTGDPKPVFYLE